MTYPSKTLLGLAVSCSLFVIGCDTDPGDVGESAEDTGSSDTLPSTSDPTASGTSSASGTTADPSVSGTTTDPSASGTTIGTTTDRTSTTASPTGSGDTGSDTEGESTTGSDTEAGTGTDDSGTGGTQVDDCSECGADEVCVRYVALAAESFCFPMPDACEDGIDCACGSDFCNELYDQCIEPAEEGILNCECSICA